MKKRLVLTMLTLIALMCGVFSAVMASADAVNDAFGVKDGAWIRSEAPAGIRFIVTVDKEYIDGVQAENEGKTIVFGTEFSIPETENVIRKDVEVWANESTEEVKSYKTVLVGIPEENYLTRITARAYYKVIDGETEEKIVYAEGAGVTRSIFEVAKAAASAGETNDFVTEIINNACKTHKWDGGKVVSEATETVAGEKEYTCTKCGETKIVKTLLDKDYECYVSVSDGARVANTAGFSDMPNGTASVAFNGKTYNAVSGSAVIPAADLIAAEAGVYNVTADVLGETYEFSLNVITKKITTAEDMLNIQTYGNLQKEEGDINHYDGYFVLGNNIDFKGAENNSEIAYCWFYGAEVGGFHGTFDGRGYTIKNVNITTSGGLFGAVNGVGTIKNVAFENITMSADIVSGVFGAEFCGTMENVFVSVTMKENRMSGAIANFVTAAKITDSVFVVTGNLNASQAGTICNELNSVKFENCYLITELDKLWTKLSGDCTLGITEGTTSVTAKGLDESIWYLDGDYPVFLTGTKEVSLGNREYEKYTGIAVDALVANTADLTITVDGATSATFNGNEYTAENGNIVIPAADLVSSEAKEHNIKVKTEGDTYVVNLSLYTKKITTMEDMLNIQTYGNLRTLNDVRYYDGYFVLGNNIDFNGAENNSEIAFDWFYGAEVGGFHGTFDGRGYTIKNVNVTTIGGLFGSVNGVGTVKNVAFENITMSEGIGGGVFGAEFCGTMKNVFVSVTMNGNTQSGAIANYVTGAKVTDCVFVVSGTIATSGAGAICNDLGGTRLENCYVVTTLNRLWTKANGACSVDVTERTISVTAKGLDESIWYLDGDYPVFLTGTKEVSLGNREYEKYTGIADGAPVANTVDLTITVDGAISATFNGNEYTAENGNIVIPAADLVSAKAKEYKIRVRKESEVCVLNLSLYTKKITTAEDMLNIQTYGNIQVSGDVRYYDGYFVLGNDVDFNGAESNSEIACGYFYGADIGGFHGTFDGKGYAIRNVNVTTTGGLFGSVNGVGTVKNVAFENITMAADTAGGVFGAEFCGTMKNVFVSVTMNGNTQSGAMANYVTGAKVTNCVFVVTGTIAASGAGTICNELGHSVLENCYLIAESDKLWTKTNGACSIGVTEGTTSVTAKGLDESIWDMSGDYPVFKN